jgi:ketosteroid isomerase-like protein
VTADTTNSKDPQPDPNEEQPLEGQEMEDFFSKLPGNFRRPKPNAESVAAAAEAIQRLSASSAAPPATGDAGDSGSSCSACGGALPASARFCFWCGIPTQPVAGEPAGQYGSGGQHHVHHHYHHVVPGPAVSGFGIPGVTVPAASSGGNASESEPGAARGRAPGSPGISTGGRAEAGARQVVQDWAQACNTRHIDDLLELYAADATLIRSSVPPVRSLPAIREFLISLLEAGLGDVEMESLRLEMLGDIALDLGRCKMLVPVAMGKRREERGKYLVVLVRQPAGTWKILADCWSADLAVSAPPPEPVVRKGIEPAPVRKPR